MRGSLGQCEPGDEEYGSVESLSHVETRSVGWGWEGVCPLKLLYFMHSQPSLKRANRLFTVAMFSGF